jgi:hypothetical protein
MKFKFLTPVIILGIALLINLASCKKETATEIYTCLQYKLGVLNIDCGCK